MNLTPTIQTTSEQFFLQSAGKWHSQRRYYTLNSSHEPVLEANSEIEVIFLAGDRPELADLAEKHQLKSHNPFSCGAQIIWQSTYTNVERKPLAGNTIFGIRDNFMYRDRGFSTDQPVVAQFELVQPNLIRLHTAYDGSSFEEEIKHIGNKYRTRQTIISKFGQEVMIGQYLETRR